MKKTLITAGLLVAAGSAQAALIASESFYTTDSAIGSYKHGNSIASDPQNENIAGTVGFTTGNKWSGITGIISPNKWYGTVHSAMVGSASAGSANIWKGSDANSDISVRQMGSTPVVSGSYFFSGTLRPQDTTGMRDGEIRTMGMNHAPDGPGGYPTDISTGMHYGVRQEAGVVYLAAFAGGNSYNMLDITGESGNILLQVVLQLDVDASGNESFSAAYAWNNATDLTSVVSGAPIESWDSASDMEWLWLQREAGSTIGANSDVLFDEARFGTTLADVTTYDAIPEPATLGLIGMVGLGLLAARRLRLD